MLDVVAYLFHLGLDRGNLLVHCLGVELGDLADRFLDKPVDVFHDDLPSEKVLVVLHLIEHVPELFLPALLVLFQDLVDPVLKEYPFERVVVPFVLKFSETYLQLPLQQVLGVEGVVDEYVLDAQKLGLVVHDNAGVRSYVALAVGEGVESVDGLVGGNVVGKVDDDLDLVRRHVLDLLDLDLALVLSLDYGVLDDLGSLPVRNLGDGDRVLVDLLDLGADLHAAAAGSVLVVAAVCAAAGGEVRVDREVLALEDVDGCVKQFVEVVWKDLGGHAYGNSLCSLCKQERKAHREFGRFLVASVVGSHPMGDLRIEDHFLGEFAEAGLDVPRGSVAVTGEDVTPVSLAVDQQTLLAQLDQGSQDGSVTMGMVLHRLSDNVGHLGVAAVVHLVHGVEYAPLYGLESVHDVGDGPLEDHIRGIIQEPVLEHPGQLELVAVRAEKLVELPRRWSRSLLCRSLFLIDVFLILNIFPLVFRCHYPSPCFILRNRICAIPCGFPASQDPPSRKAAGRPSSGRSLPCPAWPRCPSSSGRLRPCRL